MTLAADRKVWALYDSMNEEVVGVFSSEELATAAMKADPQSDLYLDVEAMTLDEARER